MLHKLRRAMVNAAREPLHGEIEVDDTWIGGPQPGLRGSRQLKGRRAALVLVAVVIRYAAQNHWVSGSLALWRTVPEVSETWCRQLAHGHRRRSTST